MPQHDNTAIFLVRAWGRGIAANEVGSERERNGTYSSGIKGCTLGRSSDGGGFWLEASTPSPSFEGTGSDMAVCERSGVVSGCFEFRYRLVSRCIGGAKVEEDEAVPGLEYKSPVRLCPRRYV